MKQVSQLKELLIEIKNNEWKIPEEVDPYQLSLKMMENIGSTDLELRDHLIYSGLWTMISKKIITEDQMKEILALSLSEKHLFYNVGVKEDDSVFNRAFSILIVAAVIWFHNQNGEKLLAEEEVLKVHRDVVRYTKSEQDIRGYVEQKGWAHSTAHAADALDELAICSSLKQSELMEILEVIKEKVSINDYTYINEEDERLVTAVINIVKRNILSEGELVIWVKSFEKFEKTNVYHVDDCITFNIKNFMRSLYFRLKNLQPNEKILNAIEEVLESVNKFK
ncbi:DUF2785 domain-containing protein [Chengkuizengella sediminis]|uniref:DUF2785 domain-containing protein n=1 Tax=Chengkuizengella sediminis TaxID=1885917 RepID=UPI001389D1BB|nr:DUF2785 domain-containing protein [Chengkuizengella sediminis]NDI36538.1 DUF2785 domain-containing protein [Chengkuizengella sediminis]